VFCEIMGVTRSPYRGQCGMFLMSKKAMCFGQRLTSAGSWGIRSWYMVRLYKVMKRFLDFEFLFFNNFIFDFYMYIFIQFVAAFRMHDCGVRR
jgi:hypothetical protein